jgi:hypothetical protein
MSYDEARELIHLFERIGGYLNQSAAFVRDCDDENNFLAYRDTIGKLMADVSDAMGPLYKRFPELLPDYYGGPYKFPESAYFPLFYDLSTSTSGRIDAE